MHPLAAALLAVPALLAASPGGARPRRMPPDRLTLVYTADLGGTLEPCGCTEEQRGGLPRLAAALARIRTEGTPTVFVGGGDLLFENPLEAGRREQDLAKARAAAEALRLMGLDATVAGERDRVAGEDFLARTGLRVVRGARLGLLGFGEWDHVPEAPIRVAVVHRGGTLAALPLAEEARRRGVHLIVAAHREDLLADDFNRAVLDAPVPVVQVQGRGQSLLRVDFFLRGDRRKGFAVLAGAAERDEALEVIRARRMEYRRRRAAAEALGRAELARAMGAKIEELAARERALASRALPEPPDDRPSLRVSFVPVGPDLPEDRGVRRVLTRFYGEIARENLRLARAQQRPCPDPASGAASHVGIDDPPRGGTFGCRTCHVAAVDFWRTTAHARAFATLERGGRQYDLDCIGCHVTGWREAGGACSVADTAGRRDVQCESCHGPASLHAVDPPGHLERDPGETRCRRCHTDDHSTTFEYLSYRRRILGPGHGAAGGK